MPTLSNLPYGSNEGIEILRVPGQYPQIPSTYQWNYTTTASAALNGRTLTYKRGCVLGGSSSISGFSSLVYRFMILMERLADAMIYSRGAASDYDSWVTATENSSWSWAALEPYFARVRAADVKDPIRR